MGRGNEEDAGILTRRVGVMTDLVCMTRSRVLYNVTQNNGGVEDPQYLSNFRITWQNQGKTDLSLVANRSPVYTSEPNLALGKQDVFILVARIDQPSSSRFQSNT